MAHSRVTRCQAFIIKEGKILILHQYNSKRKDHYWQLPGGSLEEGETPEKGVIRELKEEIDLDIEVEKLLFNQTADVDVYKNYMSFLCKPLSEIHIIGENNPDHKILEAVWVPILDRSSWDKGLLAEKFYPPMEYIRKWYEENNDIEVKLCVQKKQ